MLQKKDIILSVPLPMIWKTEREKSKKDDQAVVDIYCCNFQKYSFKFVSERAKQVSGKRAFLFQISTKLLLKITEKQHKAKEKFCCVYSLFSQVLI